MVLLIGGSVSSLVEGREGAGLHAPRNGDCKTCDPQSFPGRRFVFSISFSRREELGRQR